MTLWALSAKAGGLELEDLAEHLKELVHGADFTENEGPMFERLATLLPTPVATLDAWSGDRMAVLNTWWDALPYPRVKRWWTQWPDVLPSRSGKMAQWLQAQDNG